MVPVLTMPEDDQDPPGAGLDQIHHGRSDYSGPVGAPQDPSPPRRWIACRVCRV